jgi:hypothetical protein
MQAFERELLLSQARYDSVHTRRGEGQMAVEVIIPIERIEKAILLIRGHKVMLDSDLAELYEVETFNLNKAVKRNRDRFPSDFMFQFDSTGV